jgi:hypothetical protein
MNHNIEIGSLVSTELNYNDGDVVGIVTEVRTPLDHKLWYDQDIVTVLYPDTGEEYNWASDALRLVT